jgi:Kef-type K+ transport system membrane component KefB
MTLYHELAALLALAALGGLAGVWLRQPLVLVYIVVGIALGPSALDWVKPNESIDLLAQVGVTVLLFVVGLKLDLHLVRHLGAVALATGLGQLGFTIVIGYGLALALGLAPLPALYVAVALTFSSTIIIVKLLSDKREIDSLHGRIAMGFLIVQDIAVVVAMMVIGTTGAATGLAATLAEIALKILAALVGIALLMRYVPPLVGRWLARSHELLLVFAVALGTSLAALGDLAGFSREIGAFLAGFALASTPYREAIAGRVAGLRDFLLLFFFVDLGAKLDLSTLGAEVPAAAAFALFVLIGNPLIVMAILGYMGYRRRTGFLAGLTVAQISEFSIVFVAMGVRLGHVGPDTLGLVTLVGVITIAASVYLILHSHALYPRLERWLGVFERRHPFREERLEHARGEPERPDVLIFGVGRYGRRLATVLAGRGVRVLGVDFDPEVVRHAGRLPFPVRFGDAEDAELLDALPLERARWAVITVPEAEVGIALARGLRRRGFAGRIALVARDEADGGRLRRAGADEVLTPFSDAADFAATRILGKEGAA